MSGRTTIQSGSKSNTAKAASYRRGLAAHDFETGDLIWDRSDLKSVGDMRYDAFEDLLYCFCDGRTVVLKAWNGLGHAYYRQLDDAFFDAKSGLALLDSSNLKLLDRETHRELLLVREGNSILCAAFTRAAVVLSWVGGPVTAYELKNGHELWTHKPNGTHAYSIATASDDRSVWVAEQRRILRLSSDGEFIDEVSGSLGLSFKVLPYSDSVIRDDLAVTPNVDLKQ